MPDEALFLGLDLGTSGARAVVIDAAHRVRATAKSALADHGANPRDPAAWWAAAETALRGALAQVDSAAVRALAVDGTSGTMVGLDAAGEVIGDGLMYNDACSDPEIIKTISNLAPATSAAHGPTSGAARAILLARRGAVRVAHQADWIAGRLSGDWVSDANNALKTGYDPVKGAWPDWLARAGVDLSTLPSVVEPGTVTGRVQGFGLTDCLMVAGTTDGCASFLATGASEPGDGVSALGTTLTVKLLSDRPIFAPEYGIYSHRLLGQWLAGGASNSGGAALLVHFTPDQMAALSARIDPETDTGFDYYPLPAPGERFPIADPAMPPRITPRPQDDATFLQGLFEGVANVEALAFRRLAELGAPALRSVRSVGGGAANPVWTRLRARRLNVPMPSPLSDEAAFGTALLALRGTA
jgi:xylulokinase